MYLCFSTIRLNMIESDIDYIIKFIHILYLWYL